MPEPEFTERDLIPAPTGPDPFFSERSDAPLRTFTMAHERAQARESNGHHPGRFRRALAVLLGKA